MCDFETLPCYQQNFHGVNLCFTEIELPLCLSVLQSQLEIMQEIVVWTGINNLKFKSLAG